MRCHWMLVVASLVVTGTQASYQASYVPIHWAKFPGNEFVLTPRGFLGNLRGLLVPQKLVVVNPPSNSPSMIPHFMAKSDDTIVLEESGLCLEADGINNGDEVSVNRCSGGPAQQWERVSDGHGRQRIQLKSTNMCLEVVHKDGIDAAQVRLNECENKVTESWRFDEQASVLRTYAATSETRHVVMLLLALAGIGALSFGAWFQRSRPKAWTMAASPDSISLANLEGGMAVPMTLRAAPPAMQLNATILGEAPSKLAEEAINAAVRSVDNEVPGQEEIDDDGCRISYVSQMRLGGADNAEICAAVDANGLPLVYNVSKLNDYWGQFPNELGGRWGDFLGVATPWIGRVVGSVAQGRLEQDQKALAIEAVDALQSLGPTFIKLGQVLSIRPDVLPPVVMDELSRLQDNIATFDTAQAHAIIEEELGRSLNEIFSELTPEPIAAASLAQVYRGRLLETGVEVAVKVQRPEALTTVSKDLYVLRKAAGVVTDLSQRFTSQTTDFRGLVETFGEGLYTEMDFQNEALNQKKMAELIRNTPGCEGVIVPEVYLDYTTRRVLVSQWINGTKLSELEPARIKRGIKDAQNVFLNQLLTWGYFHGDPHPGNLLYVTDGPDEGKLVLLDFGLVAQIPQVDRDSIVTAVIHLGTQNWDGLIDDYINLGFLPKDCDRAVVTPVMKRVLSPYLKGGGAAAMNFTALGQDLLQATLEIPFSIPPYVSLLARSIATLEGIALAGDPGYRLVGEAYPFVVRKLLEAPDGSKRLAASLRELLVDEDGRVRSVRLTALLQAAVGVATAADDQEGFIDFDAVPKTGADTQDIVKFLTGPGGRNLKPVIVRELATTLDLTLRTANRRAYQELQTALKPRLPLFGALPTPPPPPLPLLTPGGKIKLMSPDALLDALQPKLDREEEIYFQSSAQVFLGLLGLNVDPNKGVDLDVSPKRIIEVLRALASQKDDEMQQVINQLLRQRQGRGLVTEWWADLALNLRDLWRSRLEGV